MNNETLQAYYVEGMRDKIAGVLEKESAYTRFDHLLRQKALPEPVAEFLRKYLGYIDEGSDPTALAKIQQEFLSGKPSKAVQPELPGFDDLLNKQSAEKVAGLASVIARMKQPLRVTGWKRPSTSNKVIHRALNTINPQLGKKYQRHVEFTPKAFGSYSSKTPGRATEWDMPITDRLLDVAENADELGYNVMNGVPRSRADNLVAKMHLHSRNQTKSLSSPFRNLFTDRIS